MSRLFSILAANCGAPLLVAALVCLLAAPVLGAQDIQVQASLDRSQVALNEDFTISLDISGSRTSTEPELPDLSEFARFLGSGSSQRISIVGGQTSVTLTLEYRYQATKQGSFRIPPIAVEIAGKTYRTEPLDLSVTRTPRAAANLADRDNPRGDPQDLFLRADIEKRQVYENEPVVVEFRLYTLVRITSYRVVTPPGTPGFWAEEFPLPESPRTQVEVFQGRRYTAATLKKLVLFPTSAGQKTIEPMAVDCEIQVRSRSSRPGFDDFFRDSLLFGRRINRTISTQPLTLDVRPLPEDGRPKDFSGLVGSLDLKSSIDKSSVEINNPVTFKLVVSGRGNLKSLPTPQVAFSKDFEVYPPKTSDDIAVRSDGVSGKRTYEYVLIPRLPGTKEIPAVQMSYFDPSTGTYRSAGSGALSLDVTGDMPNAPLIAGRPRSEITPLREDIRFIKTASPVFQAAGATWTGSPGFWLVVLLPWGGLGAAALLRRHQDRMAGDIAYARGRRASRLARRRLAKARSLAVPAGSAEFYAETQRALLGLLGDRLNIAEAGLVTRDLRQLLSQRGVPAETIDRLVDCLATCDRQRFSPAGAEADQMGAFLRSAENLMADLDKELRK